ncbi:MAG: trypsin-like peptidase domain-containing protein [Planctomycetes bacterium]|nr:trypsin-like peptidase domain-containing protein [Planctomycetota bacterium]
MRVLAFLAFVALALPAPAQDPTSNVPADLEEAVRAAIERAAPWTVRIEALGGSAAGSGPLFDEEGKPRTFNPAVDAATTGVIVRSDGLIATSTFNLETNPRILTVLLQDGREFTAKVLGKDTTRMIALIQIEAEGLPTPEIAPVDEIEVGSWALALGRTFSAPREFPTVNLGIVSAKGRHGGRALQSDASINPSNYGGPLVDVLGRALGILVPMGEEGGPPAVEFYDSGIGFAIPLADVVPLVPRLAGGLSMSPGFLGVRADETFAGPGVRVSEVLAGTAAEKGGMKAGDVLVSVDGTPVENLAALQGILAKKYAGDVVGLEIRREERELGLLVTLMERP